MSETTTNGEARNPIEEQDPPEQRDPADPATAVDAIREQLAESERRYQRMLAEARGAQQQTAVVTEQLQTVQQDRDSAEFASVANALDSAVREGELLQDQIAAAAAEGDFKKVGALNLQAGRVGARIEQLEAGKREMEGRRNQALRQPPQEQQRQQPQQQQGDPIEADLSRRDARAAAWIRSHADANGRPRFYTDEAFQNRVIGADALAVGQQPPLVRNSPEYFQFVERTVGLTNQQSNGGGNGAQSAPQRTVPQAAPSRQTASLHSQTRPRNDGHIPKEFVDHCVKVYGFTKKDSNGRQVPDEKAIATSWAESRRMAQSQGRDGYMIGDPWARSG